jgi:hypothetical protein
MRFLLCLNEEVRWRRGVFQIPHYCRVHFNLVTSSRLIKSLLGFFVLLSLGHDGGSCPLLFSLKDKTDGLSHPQRHDPCRLCCRWSRMDHILFFMLIFLQWSRIFIVKDIGTLGAPHIDLWNLWSGILSRTNHHDSAVVLTQNASMLSSHWYYFRRFIAAILQRL